MKLGATELGERRAVTPRLSCEIPSDVCYCKYAEALYARLAGGWRSQKAELTEGWQCQRAEPARVELSGRLTERWQCQRVEPARVELSGRWNSLAGDSNEVEFTCWGLQPGGIHLLGTPTWWNSLAGDSSEVEFTCWGLQQVENSIRWALRRAEDSSANSYIDINMYINSNMF